MKLYVINTFSHSLFLLRVVEIRSRELLHSAAGQVKWLAFLVHSRMDKLNTLSSFVWVIGICSLRYEAFFGLNMSWLEIIYFPGHQRLNENVCSNGFQVFKTQTSVAFAYFMLNFQCETLTQHSMSHVMNMTNSTSCSLSQTHTLECKNVVKLSHCKLKSYLNKVKFLLSHEQECRLG